MIRSVQHALFAVIGDPVEHSLSPVMMAAAFEALRYPGVYLAFEVKELEKALGILHIMGFRGLSVTVPHKQAALSLCVSVDGAARSIGAVNTLKWSEKGWIGRNTDWIGVVRALESAGRLPGCKALVIGAGGAARAVVYGLVKQGVSVTVANRTEAKAEALAREMGCRYLPMDGILGMHPDIVIQCTSVGLVDDVGLLPDGFLDEKMLVMDIVYGPTTTRFQNMAKKAGSRLISGLEMLLHQGAEQLTWWLRRPAPVEEMKRALDTASKARKESNHEETDDHDSESDNDQALWPH